MGVARQAPTTAASRLVFELKADREDESKDKLDKRLGVAQERNVGRLIVEVDSDGAVLTRWFGELSHVSSLGRWPSVRMRHREGNALKYQAHCEGVTILPRNPMECGLFQPYGHLNGVETAEIFNHTTRL
jgi:hypothetical protein